ncbi:MAG: hypothetical protein JXP34_25920, partial [Planctomycetes bacterium]|nr:hypothetical protein [Planctomycetota bacterium]
FIMTNTFPASVFEDWSAQLKMSASAGVINDYYTGNSLPLATDQWAEITVEIDLNENLHTISYNGIPLSLGNTWSAAGRLSFRAIDLYAESTTECYYDDLSVEKVCVPLDVARTIDPGSTAEIEGEVIPVYIEGNPMSVTLTLRNIRQAGGDCPPLGDLTIEEVLPEEWTATDISGGGTFAKGIVVWEIPAESVAEGTLTYRASGPVKLADVSIAGTVTEEGNPNAARIRATIVPAGTGALLSDGSIVRWLILGPYVQDVLPDPQIENPTAVSLEQDFLSDGIGIFEASVRPAAGDRVATACGTPASAAIRLAGPADGATRPDLNPGGIPTWFSWRDLDGIVAIDDSNVFGGRLDNCMAYAVCYIDVQERLTDVYFTCGSDDGFQLLIDGAGIWTNAVYRDWQGFKDIVGPIDLETGVHCLMLKTFEASGSWSFGVRLWRADGSPLIDGYTVCLDPAGCGAATPARFIRGDADGNAVYTIGDGVQVLERLFSGRETFDADCEETGDVDGNGTLTIGDAVWLFNYLLASGAPPAAPAPACGAVDPEDLKLGCAAGTVAGCR